MVSRGRPVCNGAIETIRGHDVAVTGKVVVAGEWVFRDDLVRRLLNHGARDAAADRRKRTVTLLVVGELGDNVIDWRLGRSLKLAYYENQRLAGNHVCIVDDAGISALLRGDTAAGLESRFNPQNLVEYRLPKGFLSQ